MPEDTSEFGAILFALPVIFAAAVLIELAFKKSRALGALAVISTGLLVWVAWLNPIPFLAISMILSIALLVGWMLWCFKKR